MCREANTRRVPLRESFRMLGSALRLALLFAAIVIFMLVFIMLGLIWRLVNLPLAVWRRFA